jgi:hypothetical protein
MTSQVKMDQLKTISNVTIKKSDRHLQSYIKAKLTKIEREITKVKTEIDLKRRSQYPSITSIAPPTIKFTPFDLDEIGYAQDQPSNEDSFFASYQDIDIVHEQIVRWCKNDASYKINTMKVCVTNCMRFINKEHFFNCETCDIIKIGIFKLYGSTAGQQIFFSLREAQHLIAVLIETIEIVKKCILKEDNHPWYNEYTSNRLNYTFIDTKTKVEPITFEPVDFVSLGLKPDKNYDNISPLYCPEVVVEKVRKHLRQFYCKPTFKIVNSIKVSTFNTTKLGDYHVTLYKATGVHKGQAVCFTILEAQHLVLRLMELVSEGVRLHMLQKVSKELQN